MTEKTSQTLAELRSEIDRLDRIIHDALISRSEVIENLIAAKQTAEKGASFRPAREASMLRALAERHQGILPFTVIEHIWREIIAAFTQMQGAFTVHVEETEDRVMRDAVRYHFGFSTPIEGHMAANDVVKAVLDAPHDLGLMLITENAAAPWWEALAGSNGQIIARYPFVQGVLHGAETPCLLIARDVTEQAPLDYATYACRLTNAEVEKLRQTAFVSILAVCDVDATQMSVLFALPRETDLHKLIQDLAIDTSIIHTLGGYCAPISFE